MLRTRIGAGLWIVSLLLLAVSGPVLAQDGPAAVVVIDAADGLTLVGDYYAPVDPPEAGAPGVLLLHMLNSSRAAWTDFAPDLVDAGYAVLAVDMRGHGATGGSRDWPLAEADAALWLDWLRAQDGIDPAQISVVGGSIGSNLALRVMANDEAVVTAVALSPGLDYQGVTTEDALAAIGDRPVYLVAGQADAYSALSVKQLALAVDGDALLRLYDTRAHGTGLFPLEDDLAPSIVQWLDAQTYRD